MRTPDSTPGGGEAAAPPAPGGAELGLSGERRALRRRHIGGSEVAALFNLSPFSTRLELYLRKRGELPEPDLSAHEPALWGIALEAAIGEQIGERTGWAVRKVRRYVTHPAVAGMGCSLDFEIVNHQRGPGVLEIKTVDRWAFRSWEGGWPPIHYELQLQHQLACTRRAWGVIGVLVGGNELRLVPYERHAGAIARLEREVGIFWREVEEGRPPRPDYCADLATLTALHRHAARGSFLDLRHSARARRLCEEYSAAAAEERAARQRREAAKCELMELIGETETVWADGFKITSSTVEAASIAYDREPYRTFFVTKSTPLRYPEHGTDPAPLPDPDSGSRNGRSDPAGGGRNGRSDPNTGATGGSRSEHDTSGGTSAGACGGGREPGGHAALRRAPARPSPRARRAGRGARGATGKRGHHEKARAGRRGR